MPSSLLHADLDFQDGYGGPGTVAPAWGVALHVYRAYFGFLYGHVLNELQEPLSVAGWHWDVGPECGDERPMEIDSAGAEAEDEGFGWWVGGQGDELVGDGGGVQDELGDYARERYRLNARIALRYAHGWSQREAADAWNQRWPDELKTFKNFSYWELWPGSTGHAPSFDNLGKLAELYECAVSDVLVDLPDFRHRDTGVLPLRADNALVALSGERRLGSNAGVSAQNDRDEWGALAPLVLAHGAPLVQRLQEADFAELTQVIVMWMQHLNPVSRRVLLSKLGAACTVAAVAPLRDVVNPAEHEQVAYAMQHPERFDLPVLRYCERMIANLRQQGDVLGPQLTLPSVMGHRQLAQRLAQAAPAEFQRRAGSAYAELTQLAGRVSTWVTTPAPSTTTTMPAVLPTMPRTSSW